MELDVYLRFLMALGVVLALIAVLAWAARRFGLGGLIARAPGQPARLGVVEVKALDSRRKLVLVRRDEREHLVLLGPSHDLLLEVDIHAPAGSATGEARSVTNLPSVMDRPPIFGPADPSGSAEPTPEGARRRVP